MSCLDTRIGVYNMADHYELPVSFPQSVRHLKVGPAYLLLQVSHANNNARALPLSGRPQILCKLI